MIWEQEHHLRAELAAATTDANDQRQRRKEAEAVNAQLRAELKRATDRASFLEERVRAEMAAHGETDMALLDMVSELDQLRADNRHLLEAMTSIACRTVDPVAAKIATDTLGRVKQ